MPEYETFVDGKSRKILLTKTGEKNFTAKIDERTLVVELLQDGLELEKAFRLKVGDRAYSVELGSVGRDKPVQIRVEEATFKTEVKTPVTKTAVTAFAPTRTVTPARKGLARNQVAEGAVTAPMTGKIVSVKVKKGDQVKQNQVLCVIEAMKMENEIAAAKAGTVREVNVSDGSSVSEGETLFIVN